MHQLKKTPFIYRETLLRVPLTLTTLGEPTFYTRPYKMWRNVNMRDKTLARLEGCLAYPNHSFSMVRAPFWPANFSSYKHLGLPCRINLDPGALLCMTARVRSVSTGVENACWVGNSIFAFAHAHFPKKRVKFPRVSYVTVKNKGGRRWNKEHVLRPFSFLSCVHLSDFTAAGIWV